METNSEITPELDNTARDQCLRCHETIRAILKQLPNPELLEASRVNKLWNYEALCALRDRGTLTAKIGTKHPACQDLGNLARDLKKMGIVQFSGIDILVANNHGCNSRCTGRVRPAHVTILKRLPWKIFSVEFRPNWNACRSMCYPAITFVEKILQDFSGVIESLSVTFSWQDAVSVQRLLLNGSFTRLKTLKLDVKNTNSTFTGFVKALVSRATNLKELQIVGDIACFDDNVLEGSSAVLVRPEFHPLSERVCESLLDALRPQTIELHQNDIRSVDLEILNTLLPTILRQSSASLKTLRMDILFIIPLMCYGVCLENVTTLQIRLDDNWIDSLESHRILDLLKGFDFTQVFPKLNQIEITSDSMATLSPENISSFVEEGRELLTERSLDVAPYTKSLNLRGTILGYTVAFWAEIFPDVKRLSVEKGDNTLETPFGFIWVHFKNLEELTVINTTRPSWTKNLDSVFCGIFPEKAAELRKMDDKDLKDLIIDPVMPSITRLKGLRTLTFRYAPESHLPLGTGPDFIFSKVTGLIGFARCPDLAVTFQTASPECAQALSHMKPYASFTSVDT